jgi:aspartate/methionine/tyrosine aminotransferase
MLRAENRFRADLEEIRGLIDARTRFVLVNSPHNPTGAVWSDGELEALHDDCAARGVGFVSDEVYHPIYHGAETRSAARLERAIVLGDMSKALCLSGLRTGWLIDRDPARRAKYTNARSYFTVSNTAVGERLASLAIRQRELIYRRARKVAQANLALLDRFFAEFADVSQWVRPAGGMTAFPWLSDGSDGREFCRRIARHGVLLAPGDCFGMPAHFRIGFAASGEKFAQGLERLADAMRGVGAAT